MGKILSRAGTSLADVYDVEGSIAGVDQLLSEDVNLVHEMGSTIFNERLTGAISPVASAATAQSLAGSASGGAFTQTVRLLGIQVVVDEVETRLDEVTVLIAGPGTTEIPIWTWVQADGAILQPMNLAGSVGDVLLLTPALGRITLLPNLLFGDQPDGQVGGTTIITRFNTSAFGAGTIVVTTIQHIAFAATGGLSSRGLPIPGW